jgi:predicted MFS family arabinose efflux permease
VVALVLVDGSDEAFTSLPIGALPSIRADLGLSYAQAGALLALMPAGTLLGNFGMIAADFMSRRALAVTGALAYAACMVTFGLADSFLALAIVSFLWGAASDLFVLATHLALVDLAGDDLEPTLASSNFLGALGALLAPLAVAGADAAGLGWRPLLVGGGVLMVGYAAWLARHTLPSPLPNDDTTPLRAWLEMARDASVLRLALTHALWDVIGAAFLGFFAIVLVSEHGLSEGAAALVLAVALTGHVLTFAFLALRPTDRAPGALLHGSSVVQLGALVGLAVLGWLPGVLVLAFVFGAAEAFFWLGLQTSVVTLRPDRIGTVWAVIAIVSVPALAIPPAVGTLADAHGLEVALVLYAAIAAALVVLTKRNRDAHARRLSRGG